jgi:hypothetical protein
MSKRALTNFDNTLLPGVGQLFGRDLHPGG